MRKVYGFNEKDAKKVTELIDAGIAISGRRPVRTQRAEMFIARVTTEITARSGTTPGAGSATILRIDYNGFIEEAGIDDVAVYNITSSTIAVDQYIGIAREFSSGKWIIILEDCG